MSLQAFWWCNLPDSSHFHLCFTIIIHCYTSYTSLARGEKYGGMLYVKNQGWLFHLTLNFLYNGLEVQMSLSTISTMLKCHWHVWESRRKKKKEFKKWINIVVKPRSRRRCFLFFGPKVQPFCTINSDHGSFRYHCFDVISGVSQWKKRVEWDKYPVRWWNIHWRFRFCKVKAPPSILIQKY